MRRIAAELAQAEVGLANLRATYAADSLMVANVGVLIERISARRSALTPPHPPAPTPASPCGSDAA